MPINTKMCMLPDVNHSNARNIPSKKANATSRMRRNVGWRDEPGVNNVAKKEFPS